VRDLEPPLEVALLDKIFKGTYREINTERFNVSCCYKRKNSLWLQDEQVVCFRLRRFI